MKNQVLSAYIQKAIDGFDQIPAERLPYLQAITEFVQEKINAKETINLTLICTHNSRRSHLSQVWTQVAAYYYGIKDVFAYSGGTEATALFPSAAQALTNAGLDIATLAEGGNPIYSIKYEAEQPAIIGFSKKFDHPFNPSTGYAAVMTCNHADANCPIIPGAKRLSLPFEDPKAFDGTDEQQAKYDERCLQIATELLYVFSKV
ncbi:protein-tyrosine-phosphatase [Algivirga pacifica]|uniref:Protein-tyrosine-phosphatase n=1 Tax=Algivirga pacifica TaxID=1162670 RepID=A0ABP9DFN6_9BACT